MGPLLGQGASGLIHRVEVGAGVGVASAVDAAGTAAPLALKLFKGAVTSDGLPEHELAACRAAGQHSALCTPSAELTGHPEGLAGLLLPLIPPSWVPLAGPPSLESCTRDVYPATLRLSASTARYLAQQVASAVAHLHAHGVVHGDLYAHNILWHPATGQAMLSDFGAATLLPQHDLALCAALQALEVRAFGHLLEELVAQVRLAKGVPEGMEAVTGVAELAQACLSAIPAQRPGMAEVAQALR